ncbi:MAG TPA: AAA family ATPase [Streptosporangiaceae bacterium]|nr:AAA family ATPase [Streptosporangiaceae bacterium]
MTDRDDLQAMRKLIDDALGVLAIQSFRGIYPYAVTNGEPLRLGQASMSTNSMVCYTIASLVGMLPQAVSAVGREQADLEPAEDQWLRCRLERGLDPMISHIIDPSADSSQFFSKRQPEAGPFDSGTFGRREPFTITWLVELLRLASQEPGFSSRSQAAQALEITEETARQRVAEALAMPSKPVLIPARKDERAVLHPLPLLRIVQLCKLLGADEEQQLSKVTDWFADRLHMQLSLRSIEHAPFDPAELVFALEGLVETSPHRVTQPIINSFIACINMSRQIDPTLRAITPFKATESGAVHFFVGVEVFASLLRIARAREQSGDPSFFEQLKPVLHDYLQRLQATVVTGMAKLPPASDGDSYPADTPVRYLGWESEYAHTGDQTIHVWLTSQVILLLQGYEALLTRSVARAELERVGLVAEPVAGVVPGGADERRARALADDPLQVGDSSPYRVLSRVEETFVGPRLASELSEASYSCLLYGPPGTGKTRLARRVAGELSWPLLTITTSDFIVDGEAQVEARAKDIFASLLAQRDVVVFFDEIDQLILDRDTHDFKNQGDMLQFMTPSMLTKINRLRQSEQVIIFIATNYAERIDHAIKGLGRVDEQLLVLPPDLGRRQDVIRRTLAQRGDSRQDDEDLIRRAAVCAALQTVMEVRTATQYAARSGNDLVEAIGAVTPAITLDTYMARLRRGDGEGSDRDPAPELLEEAFLLMYLLMEGQTGQALPEKYEQLGNWWSASGTRIVRDAQIRAALDEIFR